MSCPICGSPMIKKQKKIEGSKGSIGDYVGSIHILPPNVTKDIEYFECPNCGYSILDAQNRDTE